MNNKKTIGFWLDEFIVKDLRIVGETIDLGNLDPKYIHYKFCECAQSTASNEVVSFHG